MRSKFLSTLALTATLAASPAALDAAPDQTLGMAIMSASVNTGCLLARGAGATGANLFNTGICDVAFNRDVTDCTYAGMIGNPGSSQSPAGEIAANPSSATTVFVRTRDSEGELTDLPFHLIVFCAG
jgi:hypothetical protein